MITIDYKKFLKKHGLTKIISFYPEEIDIVKCKCAMNMNREVFNVGDKILINGKRLRVLAFAAYDDDYFGAIVVGKDNAFARFVRLEEAINYTNMKKYKGDVRFTLLENGFKEVDESTFVKGKITIEVTSKDKVDVYADCSGSDKMDVIVGGLAVGFIGKFIEKLESSELMYANYERFSLEDVLFLKSGSL